MSQYQNHADFIQTLEHDDYSSPETKRVSVYGWDSENLQKTRLALNPDGTMAEPVPTTGNNPIIKLYTNASGELVKVEKIIGSTTYTKTSDVTDQTITSTVTYSAWT